MAIKDGVNVTKDNVKGVLESIACLAKQDVLIGIPQEKADRRGKGDAMNNATLGYIHEFGSPAANIPARPFLIPGVREAIPKAMSHLRGAAKAAMADKKGEFEAKLGAAGMVAQNTVRAKINSGIVPALAESTLAARRRRGRTGEVPLIDTGSMRNSISYVIRKKDHA